MLNKLFPGGKGGRCLRLKTLPSSCAVFMKSENFNFWNPLGHSRPVTGLLYLYLYLYSSSSSSSSCSLRVTCIPCSLILKVEFVPPSLLRSSNVPSSFWSVFQCLFWQSISVHPLHVLQPLYLYSYTAKTDTFSTIHIKKFETWNLVTRLHHYHIHRLGTMEVTEVGSIADYFFVLSLHLLRGTNKNHD